MKLKKNIKCVSCKSILTIGDCFAINSNTYCLNCITMNEWLDTKGGRTISDVISDQQGLYINFYSPKVKYKRERYYLPDQFQVKRYALRMSHL